MKVLLVSSSGGHLAQLMCLRPWWGEHERHWVTFDTPDAVSKLAGEEVTWAHHPTTRNVGNLLRNTALARRVLAEVRPDVVVSTGAAVAVPFFWMHRLYGVASVYLEVFDRIETPTLTGRLCRPVTDLFLVQWPEQQQMYRSSVLLGSVW
ncbi:UDP-N-acetylglucosamine--LPS N-acetylglucosamine transferase [Nocardioides marmotae]|uniref:UDP-N-acetylglucosamine--LPS N-acetylglucosamine transferase n=1 Tax=Nocardioides marmotae TaxID=2663857 RepID=A0A6I3JEF1_9ACTN|nr:UDP-N-acetylglucosamine--LPS N-acetylglucosamine transferase [Nocardioides marmotae]MCR6032935.1 UDP-N-acetylglucosamine--LPS N-acetylglucosamine transferase [Gordonia jinghuaiqii]MBC9733465.1 UDP-N-acetylglucosamine--LPS N-acetylglucosamine transferase [Nocardioides marmotae]MTB84572.1 UDP-N-acetylglucosamine--LPS N-acetylglucosamine transferase [Nocardioides marmotae]MTB96586.1 UDP-N-acetylglucosamine--LPS N-acetylglucosamine transferase [Nocardioides marmotae]QKE01898.1 UDP-N-acetylgluco